MLAARMAREYSTLVLGAMDLRTLARVPAPETTEDPTGVGQAAAARAQRHDSSVHELVMCLRDAFRVRGGAVEEVPCVDITRACAVCGAVDKDWDPATSIRNQCVACGVQWDQDSNAAHNLLQLWARERSGGADTPGGSRARDVAGLRPKSVATRLTVLASHRSARKRSHEGAQSQAARGAK